MLNSINPTWLTPSACYAPEGVASAAVEPKAGPRQTGHVWLDTPSVAKRLGVSPRTLERMRQTGDGPKFARAGRAVRYRDSWIDDWLESRAFSSTSAAKMAGI